MKKNNYLIFALSSLCSLAIVGCSKNQYEPSIISHWQDKYESMDSSLIRSIASTPKANQCLGDALNSESLKREVQEYEARITGNPVRGYWKHIDLSTLPIPQANFLVKYGKSIGDQSNPDRFNYSNCNDLVCVFNTIYNKGEDYFGGYVNYLWYLKFGSYLGLDNKVYEQESNRAGVYNNKSHPFETYLFRDDELYGLWRITHLLDGKYTTMTKFDKIQRIPHKELLEGKYSRACGLAYGDTSIVLADGCLSILKQDREIGMLYHGVIHELSHILDYSEGRSYGSYGTQRSNQKDYVDLVGFYKQEEVGADGKVVSNWKLKEGAKYYRAYAATNPQENFAESLAVYRYLGDETKVKINQDQYRWIGQNYYDNQNFETSSKVNRIFNKYKSKYLSRVFYSVLDCRNKNGASSSSFFNRNDFPGLSLSTNTLNCYSAEAERFAREFKAEIQVSELDGCNITKYHASAKQWDNEVRDLMKNSFKSYSQRIANNPALESQMKKFRANLQSFDMANEAILHCYQGNIYQDMSECYNQNLPIIVKNTGVSLGIPSDQADDLANLYVGSFPFRDASKKSILAYKSIADAHDASLRGWSNDLWKRCTSHSNHDDNEKPTGRYFTPTKGYLISSILNCVNEEIPNTLADSISRIEYDGMRIKNEKEKTIMLEFIAPRLNSFLDSIHGTKKKEEEASFDKVFVRIKNDLLPRLNSDFSWVKSLSDHQSNLSNCKMQSLEKINYQPLYHLKRDFLGERVEKQICAQSMGGESYKSFIKKASESLMSNVYSKISPLLISQAKASANECLKKVPWKWEKTKKTVRLPRKACLSLDWKNIEQNIVDELLMYPEVVRFNVPAEEIRERVAILKDEVKSKVEDEFF